MEPGFAQPPSYYTGIWFPNVSSLIAAVGGPDNQGLLISRLFIIGPSGSNFDLHISSEHPEYMVSSAQRGKYQVDYSLTGQKDYGSYDPPLQVPEGWWVAGAWSGGSTVALSTASMRVEFA